MWFGADDGHMCAPAVGDSLSKEEEEVLKTVMLSASAVLIPDDGSTRARARGGEAARIITVDGTTSCVGRYPTPYPTPLDEDFDPSAGFAANIHNNVWNTCYASTQATTVPTRYPCGLWGDSDRLLVGTDLVLPVPRGRQQPAPAVLAGSGRSPSHCIATASVAATLPWQQPRWFGTTAAKTAPMSFRLSLSHM